VEKHVKIWSSVRRGSARFVLSRMMYRGDPQNRNGGSDFLSRGYRDWTIEQVVRTYRSFKSRAMERCESVKPTNMVRSRLSLQSIKDGPS
jgi:hypothetical protein